MKQSCNWFSYSTEMNRCLEQQEKYIKSMHSKTAKKYTWYKHTTDMVLILTGFRLLALRISPLSIFPQILCFQHLTTVQLLPPGSQFDSSLLTGYSICLITGTTQRCTALLSTQVKHTATVCHTNTTHNTHTETGWAWAKATKSYNHIISYRDNLEKGCYTYTHSDIQTTHSW